MNTFSKKTDKILLVLSIVGLAIGTGLVLFSGNLLYGIQEILENYVFHREFKIEKWADTILSLIAFPIFFVVLFDSIFFVKFSNKTKIILCSVLFGLAILSVSYCSFVRVNCYTDSDMASDILLAKECWLKKSFWPTTWIYSTEIRMLSTQIIAAPIFAFTSSLNFVKALSAVLISLLSPISLLFLLNQLKIKENWLKFASCIVVFSPFSVLLWKYFQFGSYYIPHVVWGFIDAGLFISLAFNDNSKRKTKVFQVLFFMLSFIFGLTSIRYIIQFIFPITLTATAFRTVKLIKNNESFDFKKFFIKDKTLFYSWISLILAAFGYLANNIILQKIYSFSQYNTITFNSFGDIPFSTWFGDILASFGYTNMVSVFTPAGINNILLYIGLAFFILCTIDYIKISAKKETISPRYFFVTFSLVAEIFNCFVFLNSDYYARYLAITMPLFIPCMAIFIEEEQIFSVKKYLMAVILFSVTLSNSFITYEKVLSKDENTDKAAVTQFLDKQGYTLGYGTFWNANVFTQLTDGKIEMCNIRYEDDPWLTTSRYYAPDYKAGQKTFIILSQKEIDSDPKLNSIQIGTKVYSDKYYTVYEYQDKALVQKELHSPVFEDFIDAKTIK